ncbi:MAG TPA: hypothetical protein VGX23_05315 [Actinocrinis sp.]|nr:hypothetical protein [Actinocrinis sp.]
MILEPLPDTRRTRRNLPHLVAAAEHLRAVDQVARELFPCDHLPLLLPTGRSQTSLDDLHVAADHLGTELKFTSRCQCRTGAPRQLRAAHEIAFTLWDRTYNEAVFQYSWRRDRRRLARHTERLRRHRANFEYLAREYCDRVEEDRIADEYFAEKMRRDADETAAGRKCVGCWVCGGEFYVPNDDAGDLEGRHNCGSANCGGSY